MMIFAYDHKGITSADCIPKGTNIKGDYYANVIRRILRPKMRKLHLEKIDTRCFDIAGQCKQSQS